MYLPEWLYAMIIDLLRLLLIELFRSKGIL